MINKLLSYFGLTTIKHSNFLNHQLRNDIDYKNEIIEAYKARLDLNQDNRINVGNINEPAFLKRSLVITLTSGRVITLVDESLLTNPELPWNDFYNWFNFGATELFTMYYLNGKTTLKRSLIESVMLKEHTQVGYNACKPKQFRLNEYDSK